jgi:hypothetical protein
MKYHQRLLSQGFIPLAMDGSIVTFDDDGRPSTEGTYVWVQPVPRSNRASKPLVTIKDA